MEMKDIALMLCKLSVGDYSVETEIGNVEIESLWARERADFRVVNIKINGKLYTEIIYSNFDYCHLWENIYYNNEVRYKLKHELYDDSENKIFYDKKENEYEISSKYITNRSKQNSTYTINNGVILNNESHKNNIILAHDIELDEKILYVKRNTNNSNPDLEIDFIKIHGDLRKFISKYNKLVNEINSNNKSLISDYKDTNQNSDDLTKLIVSYAIPTIDLELFNRLEEELDEYLSIYKEFTPKLKEYHSEEMMKTLEYVAKTLHSKYNDPKLVSEHPKTKSKKFFDITKFKN